MVDDLRPDLLGTTGQHQLTKEPTPSYRGTARFPAVVDALKSREPATIPSDHVRLTASFPFSGRSGYERTMIQHLLETLNQNPFFSGGLSLMVVGAAVALLRKVPGQLWTFFQRRLSITVEIPDRDPAFRWLQVWLAAQPYAGRARDLSLATTWIPAGAESDTAVVFDPDDSAATGPSLAGEVPALPGSGHAPDALPEPARDPAAGAAATCRTAMPARSRRTCRCRSWAAAGPWSSSCSPRRGSWRALGPRASAS